jgi:hypothetical protein
MFGRNSAGRLGSICPCERVADPVRRGLNHQFISGSYAARGGERCASRPFMHFKRNAAAAPNPDECFNCFAGMDHAALRALWRSEKTRSGLKGLACDADRRCGQPTAMSLDEVFRDLREIFGDPGKQSPRALPLEHGE